MNCPACCANAEHFVSTNDGLRIACPICGEYDVASSVVATEQLRRLEPDERIDVLNKRRSAARSQALAL